MNRRQFLKSALATALVFQPACRLIDAISPTKPPNLWGESPLKPAWHEWSSAKADPLADLEVVHKWMVQQVGIPAHYFTSIENSRVIAELAHKSLAYGYGFESVEWRNKK